MMLKINSTDKGRVSLEFSADLDHDLVRFTVTHFRPGVYERHEYINLKQAHEMFDALSRKID